MKSTYALLTFLFASFATGCGARPDPFADSSCQAPSFSRTLTLSAAEPLESEISLRGDCLDEAPYLDASGDPSCFVLDIRAGGGACACDAAQGLAPATPEHADAAPGAASDCVCEVRPIAGDPADVAACENDDLDDVVGVSGQPLNGWCYVDPPHGNPALVAACPSDAPRLLRLVGAPARMAPVQRTVHFVCQTGPAVCDG